MFKNIMLPVDGSHFSELALPLAVRVAERSDAHLHVVRVHTPPVATAESIITADYEDLVRDWERDSLRVALERATASGIAATAHLIDGPVVPALQKYIEVAAIDLVVMSTHGRSGIKRAVLGSVAEQCVRKTEVPILLLRPRADDDVLPAHFVDWRRVVVALDGTEQSEAVLPHAVDFARLTGVRSLHYDRSGGTERLRGTCAYRGSHLPAHCAAIAAVGYQGEPRDDHGGSRIGRDSEIHGKSRSRSHCHGDARTLRLGPDCSRQRGRDSVAQVGHAYPADQGNY